jgi:hypothetical protein
VAFQHVGHQAVGGAAQRGQLLQQVHAFGAGLDRALQRLGLALDAAQAGDDAFALGGRVRHGGSLILGASIQITHRRGASIFPP